MWNALNNELLKKFKDLFAWGRYSGLARTFVRGVHYDIYFLLTRKREHGLQAPDESTFTGLSQPSVMSLI
jgi:hypothetical protein